MPYTRERQSHFKEIYYIICIVLVVVITIFSIAGPGGYFELKKARQDLAAMHARIEALKRTNQEKMRAIEALRSDKEAQERLARENGFGRQGEIVQQLPEKPASPVDDKRR